MEYYEYKPITAKEHTFRLILLHPASQPKIEIDIIHASLDEENLIAYEAISYVWGSQQMSTSVFVPEVQKYLKVTNSLELVLRDLRLPDTKRCLWIDGICINQHDQNDIEKIEKNHQVRLMGRIYNSAHRVLFHLGRPTELTPILKDAITEMQQHQALQEQTEATAFQDLEQELEQTLQELEELQSLPGVTELQQRQKTQELDEILNRLCEPVEAQKPEKEGIPKTVQPDWELISLILGERHDDFHIRIRQSVELVLQRPWFRRVWIIQEVANAREALMYWGATEVPVRGFIELAQVLRVGMSMHQKAILDMMPSSRRKGLALSSGQDLYDLLVRFVGAEASKRHDKIFALLGMCTMGKGHGTLAIDYSKSTKSLVREAVAYMSFCDESDVPDVFSTMESLMKGLDSLFQGLLVHFAAKSKLFSLRSLLANRGDQITITPQIIERTIQNHKGKEALSILFDFHTVTLPVSKYVVEKAIVQGNHDVMELLLTRLAKRSPCMAKWIKATMAYGFSPGTLPQYSPFGLAVMKGEADEVRQLLEEGADVDAQMFWPKTLWSRKSLDALSRSSFDSRPWFAATKHEMVGLTRVCPDKTNVEETHCRFQTALALAVHHGKDIIVQILLDHGANIEAKCGCGRTPLSIAAGRGFDGIVSQGRSTSGAQIVQRTTARRYLRAEPPVSETDKVYSELVQLLLDRGAEVNSADNFKRSPLWWAVNHGHESAVEKLLANKAQ
ncbi:heterokaryon incompatibility protein-domain-containing protein [Pestalotiopsis sp. NC0098]|nr:heterokaryon incompatibility protein-domain-containing protein [Pestalotiopsis sp. NC0098]